MLGPTLIGVKFGASPFKAMAFISSNSNIQLVGPTLEFHAPHTKRET